MSFYKKTEDNNIIDAPNAVYNSNYTLLKENSTDYEYPVDGWYWFDSIEEAENFFGLEITI